MDFKKYAIANKSVIALAISLLFLAACGDDNTKSVREKVTHGLILSMMASMSAA